MALNSYGEFLPSPNKPELCRLEGYNFGTWFQRKRIGHDWCETRVHRKEDFSSSEWGYAVEGAPTTSNSPWVERRFFYRERCLVQAEVRTYFFGSFLRRWYGAVVDFSEGGMRFECFTAEGSNVPLVNERVSLYLLIPFGNEHHLVSLRGFITHCEWRPPGEMCVGIAFEDDPVIPRYVLKQLCVASFRHSLSISTGRSLNLGKMVKSPADEGGPPQLMGWGRKNSGGRPSLTPELT